MAKLYVCSIYAYSVGRNKYIDRKARSEINWVMVVAFLSKNPFFISVISVLLITA